MNLSKLLALLVASLICTSCGTGALGLRELKRLCEKDAGLTINRSVEVDGYYDSYTNSGIVGGLADGDYQFFEFCDAHPSSINLIPEPGCWRVKRVKRSSGICHKRIDERLSKFIVDPYPEFLKKYCVAVEKIEMPTARYSFHIDSNNWLAKNGISKFRRSEVFVKDSNGDKILGKFVSYSFNKRPRHTTPTSCHNISDEYMSYTEGNLVHTVLKPTIKGIDHD